MIKIILIANRGEIASRIINTAKEMGIITVCVFSKQDRKLAYVNQADFAYPLGDGTINDTYKNYDLLIDIANKAKVDAIFIAYGFLSEDPIFISKCQEKDIKVIGTNLDFSVKAQDKLFCKNLAKSLDIKTVAGPLESFFKIDDIYSYFEKNKKPFVIKPRYGDFARAVKLIKSKEKIEQIFNLFEIETSVLYKNTDYIIEEDLSSYKHIEVPVLRDNKENILIFPQIDSSIKRWNKTVISKSPVEKLPNAVTKYINNASKLLSQKLDLVGYGVFEFLVKGNDVFFLEINPRLNVEYALSEMTTGVDIIKQIINVASGKSIEVTGKDFEARGTSIQCRIYAENPYDFSPSGGVINSLFVPHISGTRFEVTCQKNWQVPVQYDHMLLKLTAYARDFNSCINRFYNALNNIVINGVDTNIVLIKDIIKDENFKKSDYNLNYLKNLNYKSKAYSIEEIKAIISVATICESSKSKEDNSLTPISAWQSLTHSRRN